MLSKILSVFIIVLFSLFSGGCDKPNPTTLLTPDEPAESILEIEVIAKDPADVYTYSGYDSTGFIPQFPQHNSVIFLAKNILSAGEVSLESNFAHATFFDFNDTIFSPRGKIVGFHTKEVDFVKVNLLPLKRGNLLFWYRDSNGNMTNVLAGPKYNLYKRKGVLWGDLFEFVFSSFVNIDIKPRFKPPIHFTVPTPSKISGKIHISKSPAGKSEITLEWNKETSDNRQVFIILGGVERGTNNIIPLFSLKTADDGELILPKELVKGIPKYRYPQILVSFIRRIDTLTHTLLGKILVTTQSSNSIIVDNL